MTQKNDGNDPNSGMGNKVAVGTVLVAVIGLLTAIVNQGGMGFLPSILNPKVSQSSPQASPSPSLPNTVPSQPSISEPTPSTSPSPILLPSNSPKASSAQTVTSKEFIFELQQCKRASESIKCEVDIINKEKDRGLKIYGKGSYVSSLTDIQGKQYLAKYVDFGAIQHNQYVDQNLVQGIRLKAYVTFDAIPPEVKQLQIVEITAQSGELFPVRFRGVSISD